MFNKTRLESLLWKARREYQGLAKKKQETDFVMLKGLISIRLGSGHLTDCTNTFYSRGFMPALEREKGFVHTKIIIFILNH